MTRHSEAPGTLDVLVNFAGTLLVVPLVPFVYILLWLVGTIARILPPKLASKSLQANTSPPPSASYRVPASIVIPNWNGRDLLEKYLPTVVAACDFSLGDEVILVDNASEDSSAEFVAEQFPEVKLLQLPRNLGFGGGCNAGVESATNPYVVLLNSDMRVESDFLAPLLAPFADPTVFAVAAQILFSDSAKRREESGLTQANWRNGEIELGHSLDCDAAEPLPCFYPGGGSSAFCRAKFLSLGGFDHLFRPFYLEDTDLGWEAWKRGWKVLYQPRSVVFHEHRGTIGKKFRPEYVNRVIQKNRILFHWKHVLHPGQLAAHCLRVAGDCLLSLFRRQPRGGATGRSALQALVQLPEALFKRWRSARFATISDHESFIRHRPDVFHDRFRHCYTPGTKLQVLFLSPYPIYPPHHGGALLMSQTLRYLTQLCNVHLVVLLESEEERAAHQQYASHFASMHLLVRPFGDQSNRFGTAPKAVREFANREVHTLLERLIFEKRIDVVQVEYTNMAQYARQYESVATALFEHDIYFQSIARRLTCSSVVSNPTAFIEYLRALRFELKAVRSVDYVQVCTLANAAYLQSFSPPLRHPIEPALRAGIDVRSYPYADGQRDADTLLFIGNFRHTPNQEGLSWLLEEVMPGILSARPSTRLRIVGPNQHLLKLPDTKPHWLELLGAVDDVRPHLQSCAVFVCPVLTGSGVRVKLLEAFASGIPVVATAIGAEGLVDGSAPVCKVADQPADFVTSTLSLLAHPANGRTLAAAARSLVETDWDVDTNTTRLVARYRSILEAKAPRAPGTPPGGLKETQLTPATDSLHSQAPLPSSPLPGA